MERFCVPKGTVVKDKKKKRSGIITWGEDIHNIQVQWPDGEIRFFCFDKECRAYDGDEIEVKLQDDIRPTL